MLRKVNNLYATMGLQSPQTSTSASPSASAVTVASPVKVYVRARPLIEEENGHELIEYKLVNEKEPESSTSTEPASSSSLLPSFSSLKLKMPSKERKLNPAFQTTSNNLPARLRLSGRREEWKVFEGFHGVLEPDTTNEQVYDTTMKPLLSNIISSASGSENDGESGSGSNAKQSLCVFTYGHTGKCYFSSYLILLMYVSCE